jgi:HK97 family phage major capsid protein
MSEFDEVKSLISQQGEAWEAFKATHAELQAEVKKLGSADSLLEQKLVKIDNALSIAVEAKDAIDARLLAAEKQMGRPGFGHNGGPDMDAEVKAFNALAAANAATKNRPTPAPLDAEGVAAYKGGYNVFLKGGRDALEDTERKALSVGSDPDGGYLVPADMTGRIVAKIFETSAMRAICDVVQISTDALEGIADTNEFSSGGWVSETGSRSETNTAQLGTWRIPVWEVYVEPRATQQLLDDAAVDIEAWIGAKIADKLARVQNDAFINGNGVNKPRGIAQYTTAATADSSRTWGTLEHVATANNGDFASSNPGDKLFDLVGAFKDHFLQNARWVTTREVMTKIRKFKDTAGGTYLWQPGLQVGQPQQLLGYPVSIAQDMPALATGSLSMAFGDFRQGYTIVDRIGLRTLRDPYTAKPYVKFYTTARVGGGVVNFEAIKFVKFGS